VIQQPALQLAVSVKRRQDGDQGGDPMITMSGPGIALLIVALLALLALAIRAGGHSD
jgi:hypothetical protein